MKRPPQGAELNYLSDGKEVIVQCFEERIFQEGREQEDLEARTISKKNGKKATEFRE